MSKQIENYVLQEVIGEGQFGQVYKGYNNKTNEVVAIKQMNISKFKKTPKLNELIHNEIQILSQIDSSYIIKFIDIMRTQNNYYIIYEYCNGGTLESIIKKKIYIPEQEAIDILKQVLNAFKALYEKNILHRDLKPGNILFNNNKVKLADFGFCKGLQDENELTQTMVGSPIYMAPEILKGEDYNIKADIWSIGVCFYEMLFGHCPFSDKTIQLLLEKIKKNDLVFPKHIQNISQECEYFLRQVLTIDVKKRMDWNKVLTYFDKTEPKTPVQNKMLRNISNTYHTVQKEFNLTNEKNQQVGCANYGRTFQKQLFEKQKQNNQDQQKLSLLQLIKERNKVIYITEVLFKILKIQEFQVIVPWLCANLINQSEILLNQIMDQLKIVDQQNQKQLENFLELIKQEHEKINQNFQNYKKNDKNINATIIDCMKLTIKYKGNKFVQIINDILNIQNINKFFEENIDTNQNWESQQYFILRNQINVLDIQNLNQNLINQIKI